MLLIILLLLLLPPLPLLLLLVMLLALLLVDEDEDEDEDDESRELIAMADDAVVGGPSSDILFLHVGQLAFTRNHSSTHFIEQNFEE